jgi:hypothetical protein
MKTSITSSATRLHGWPLVVAGLLVLTAMAATVGLFVLALPDGLTTLATPCAAEVDQGVRSLFFTQCLIGSAQVVSLARLGITPPTLALVAMAFSCLALFLAEGAAAALLWRRSNDWMALLVALTLILAPMDLTPVLSLLQARAGVLQAPAGLLSAVGGLAILLLLVLFPSGRFVPSWLWIPSLLLVLTQAPALEAILPQQIGGLLFAGLLVCIGASQIYRYRWHSTQVERQQTKWVMYGFLLLIGVNQLFWLPYALIPTLRQPDSLYRLLAYPDNFFMLSIVVVTFSVAVLHARLWEIDIIINRTLVYGALTVILTGVYVGLVIGLSALLRGIINQGSGVATVISTLLIYFLFQPIRRGIQRIIDRRFYRRKYDAVKTMVAYSTTLRQEVDLDQLREHLLAVVQESMQPTHVSLWLRSTEAARYDHTTWSSSPLLPERGEQS